MKTIAEIVKTDDKKNSRCVCNFTALPLFCSALRIEYLIRNGIRAEKYIATKYINLIKKHIFILCFSS